jgi:hypothetical protein
MKCLCTDRKPDTSIGSSKKCHRIFRLTVISHSVLSYLLLTTGIRMLMPYLGKRNFPCSSMHKGFLKDRMCLFIKHCVVCLKPGPLSLPKRVLHRLQSDVSPFSIFSSSEGHIVDVCLRSHPLFPTTFPQ